MYNITVVLYSGILFVLFMYLLKNICIIFFCVQVINEFEFGFYLVLHSIYVWD